MTREEALEWFRDRKKMNLDDKCQQAEDMAIKALEQEPEHLVNESGDLVKDLVKDTISRQAALDCLTATGLKKYDFILDARDKIKNLPSVTPQHTDAEIQKMQDLEQAEIQKAYKLGKAEQSKTDVLDRIRAEIDNTTEIHSDGEFYIKNIDVKRIIDKYKGESEEAETNLTFCS